MGGISEGDGIVCCVSKDWRIIAAGRTTSEYYMDTSKVFVKDGLFPDRFNFAAGQVGADDEIDVKQVLDRLSFVKNLAYWPVFFRNAIVEISEADWKLINKQLPHKAASKV
jgi:predicted RNA-binding protein